jgi:uridine kinase
LERPLILGIGGGTASGKTLVARTLVKNLGSRDVVIIEQDSYYRDHSDLPLEDRARVNFDHPDAFDRELLLEHIQGLLRGQPIEKPLYDFARHTRLARTERVEGHSVVILVGILVLEDPALRRLLDIKVFIDTDADVRLIRRIRRDTRDRGRSLESVLEQYEGSVRPMHEQFVEPSKRYADVIIPKGGRNRVAIDLLVTKVRSMLTGMAEAERKSP